MFEIRIHGRGGQGAVTAAEMLSVAGFDEMVKEEQARWAWVAMNGEDSLSRRS